DAHHQLGGDARLADVVVGACGENAVHTRLVGVTDAEDHRQLAPTAAAANDATELDTADLRHLEIQQDQIGFGLFEHAPEAKRIVQSGNDQTTAAQDCGQPACHRFLIVDDEDA